jgi:hypothetical protein
MPIVSCTDCSIRPRNSEHKTKIHLKICAQSGLDLCAKSIRTVRNRTDCMNPYSMASHKRKIFFPKTHRKCFSRFVPSFLGKHALFVSHFSLSSILINLSQSPPDVFTTSSRCPLNMSCRLPNAFFYNLKMTFPPPKCLFTFPTLDPKDKIRSCLFQDQWS